MFSSTSSYYPTTHPSDEEHNEIAEKKSNKSNTKNNPYRTSLFFEENIDGSNRRLTNPQLNILNRTSTHSFTVFIDDSRYDNIQSSSSSSSTNLQNSTTINTIELSAHCQTMDSTSTRDAREILDLSASLDADISESDNHLIRKSTIQQEPTSIIPQMDSNSILRRKDTSNSITTGDTEYFETNDFLLSSQNVNTQDIPLLRSRSHSDSHSDLDSADSIDTQDTEILNTHIRASQSLLQNVRDSIRTVSTMILTQNSDSVTKKSDTDRRGHVHLPNDNSIDMMTSSQDEASSGGPLVVKNRNSSSFGMHSHRESTVSSNIHTAPNNTAVHTSEFNETSLMEPSYSSIFQYDDYNESLEPDIEQAVQLLTKDVQSNGPTVNYVKRDDTKDKFHTPIIGPSEQHILPNGLVQEENFVPHTLKIPRRLSISSPPTPIRPTPVATHVPRSPSLINKFLVTPSPKRKHSLSSSGKRHNRKISLTSHITGSPLHETVSIENGITQRESSNGSIIPKVQVLQSVSGPNRWKPNPTTKAHMVSLLGTNEFRSPIKKLSFHEDMAASPTSLFTIESHSNDAVNHKSGNILSEQTEPNNVNATTVERHDLNINHVVPSPPLSAGVPKFQYNTTSEVSDNLYMEGRQHDVTTNIRSPVYIQHIDSPSIHSFDSQSYKFWDIYSLTRVITLILICLVVPPLFFMIYVGSTCGIDDYKLMKIILNKDHRIGLFRGFIWDIDLNWLRQLSLILGSIELFLIFASVAIGFGVGLTR